MFKKSVKDAYCILRAPFPPASRVRLLTALLGMAFDREKMLGWKIQHLGRDNLRLLYSEIFARQNYRFDSPKPNPTILDCGANIGMATLFFKWLYPQAHVTAFEPDPTTFKVLEHNISANHVQDVVIHNVALADAEKEIPFHVPEKGSLMMSAISSRASGQSIAVPARRLSSFISNEVDFLKLDVEGMEGPVLQDLAQSGKLQFIREAIIEVHHNLPGSPTNLASLLQLLENSGFCYHVLDAYSPSSDCAAFQDVMIHAAQRDSRAACR